MKYYKGSYTESIISLELNNDGCHIVAADASCIYKIMFKLQNSFLPEVVKSVAIILSNMLSRLDESGLGLFSSLLLYSLISVIHSYDVRQSQIPSQAITRKS